MREVRKGKKYFMEGGGELVEGGRGCNKIIAIGVTCELHGI